MSNVENAVVSITFDNAQFERAVQETLNTIEVLKASLNFENTDQIFAGIDSAAANVNLEGIGAAVDNISNRFGALGAVAFSTIQNITNTAIDFGKRMGAALLSPILQGGASRAHAIEQARFQFEGLGQDVERSMESALAAVQGTAYGLDAAATVAAQFGASGIQAGDDMTGALRGVAGVAALTGSSFEDIGNIFTSIAGQGRLMGTNLYQFATRGLNVAAALGEQWNLTETEVREMATAGEISFQDFAAAMDEAFGEHATSANETFTGALANMRAALSRLGEDFLTPKFEAMRKVLNALSPVIDAFAASLQPLIKIWQKFLDFSSLNAVNFLEGLDFTILERIGDQTGPHILHILQNIGEALRKFIAPFGDAFERMMPEHMAVRFGNVAEAIANLTEKLIIGKDTAKKISSTFAGVIAVVQILWDVFKGVIGVVAAFFSGFSGSGSEVLSFTQNLGESLVSLKESLVDGGRINDFFTNLADNVHDLVVAFKNSAVIQFFGDVLRGLVDILGEVFDGFSDTTDVFGRFQDRFTDSDSAFQRVGNAIINGLTAIKDAAAAIFDYLANAFDGLGEAIANSLSEGDFSEVLDVLNVGVLGALTVLLQRFFDGGLQLNFGSLTAANAALTRASTTLAAMAIDIKAGALLKIAKALALLTASMLVLSLIDSAALSRALGALAVGLGELVGTLALLSKGLSGPFSIARLLALAVSMTAISIAMLLFSFAVRSLSGLSWGELIKGLFGVTTMLMVMTTATKFLSTNAPGMISAGLGLIAIGVALNIIALAVRSMAKLSWEDMAKGLLGVGIALLGIMAILKFLPAPQMLATGAGLLLIGLALVGISSAMKIMASMSWEEIAKGIEGLGVALVMLALAADFMTGALPGALAIGVMAGSLILLSIALRGFASLSWDEIIRGFVALGGALLILAIAANLMAEAIPFMLGLGLALIPLAVGLYILAQAMQVLGDMDIGDVIIAMVALAGVLTLVGVASTLLAETIPFVLAFGLSLLLLGAGFALIGVGAYLLARSFQILTESLTDLTAEAVASIGELATIIPAIMGELAEGVLAFFQIIVDAAPELIEGIIIILGDLIDGFIELAPKLAEAIVVLLTFMTSIIVQEAPRFVEAGLQMLEAFARGLRDHMPMLVMLAGDLITNFLTNLRTQIPRIVRAGFALVMAVIQGVRENLSLLIPAAVGIVTTILNGIRNQSVRIINAGVGIIVSIINGISNSLIRIINAGVNLVVKFLEGIRRAASRLTDAAFRLILGFIQDMTDAVNQYAPQLRTAGRDLAYALIDGMTGGLLSHIGGLINTVRDTFGGVADAARGILGVDSPSKVFMEIGENVVEGFGIGVSNSDKAVAGVKSLGEDVTNGFKKITDKISASLSNLDALSPTIAPVLDLSLVEQEAKRLGDILDTSSLDASASYGRAQSLVFSTATISPDSDVSQGLGAKDIKFEQNIYAPTELSIGDIYRQTRTQIHLAKAELGVL
jgi:phage-related protein